MKNLRKALVVAGGLVLILAGTTFLPKNKGIEVFKKIPLETKYALEEQKEIDYFHERATLIWSSYVLRKPFLIEQSVCEMMDKYPKLSPKIQGAVKEDFETGLFFLNGLYRRNNKRDNPKIFEPYKTKATEFGLDMKRIENTGDKEKL
jgi:hypothetical protein